MENTSDTDRNRLQVGGLSRAQLADTLSTRGVFLNPYAETLLDDVVFDQGEPEPIDVVVRSVGELGLADGSALPRIFAVAQRLSCVRPTRAPT